MHFKSMRNWSLSSAQAFFWFLLFAAGAFESIEASKDPLLRVVGRFNFMECWWKSSVVAAKIEYFSKRFSLFAQLVIWRAFARVLSCWLSARVLVLQMWGKLRKMQFCWMCKWEFDKLEVQLVFCWGLGWCVNHLTVTLLDRNLSQRMKVWV